MRYPLGTLAVHDSLLPEYRGFAPVNWSVINGADHIGVTLFYLSEAADEGDILAQHRIAIAPDKTAPEIYDRVCAATIDLVLDAYPLLEAGKAPAPATTSDGELYLQSHSRRRHDRLESTDSRHL